MINLYFFCLYFFIHSIKSVQIPFLFNLGQYNTSHKAVFEHKQLICPHEPKTAYGWYRQTSSCFRSFSFQSGFDVLVSNFFSSADPLKGSVLKCCMQIERKGVGRDNKALLLKIRDLLSLGPNGSLVFEENLNPDSLNNLSSFGL